MQCRGLHREQRLAGQLAEHRRAGRLEQRRRVGTRRLRIVRLFIPNGVALLLLNGARGAAPMKCRRFGIIGLNEEVVARPAMA